MDGSEKAHLISFLSNFSALRIVHGYKMSDDEYLFYTQGMRTLTAELKLQESVAQHNLSTFERIANERNSGTGTSKDEDPEGQEGGQDEASVV